MINGLCPKCEAVVQAVNVSAIPIAESFQPKWNGVSFLCQSCGTVLGVSFDPADLVADIVNALKESGIVQ